MNKALLTLLAGVALLGMHAADLEWSSDLPKALAKAKTERKLVLINFTGSDWQPDCVKLNKEVFGAAEFASYARNNLVLVEADFPRRKTLSEDLLKANTELKKRLEVQDLPTLVLLNSDGKKVAVKAGYAGGGPKAIIEVIDRAKGK